MATLSTLKTDLAEALRDTANATFSDAELTDLIRLGIDEVGSVYPREVVQTVGTVAQGVTTYAVTDFKNIYRVDIYTSAGVYRATVPHGLGDGPNSGWETHAGVLYLPPSWAYSAGDTVRAFGYAGYTDISADTQTTDLDTSGINAVLIFAQVEAFQRLVADRAKFQQWQTDPRNTDTTTVAMAQLAGASKDRWDRERQRLRKVRKIG